MKHFHEILLTLGATDIQLLRESGDWDFWRAEYHTPISSIHGYYLYLKYKCPQKEASPQNLQNWKSLSKREGYELVVTPRSTLAQNSSNTRKLFEAKNIRTSKQLLLDNFLKDLTWKPVGVEEYFIDPDIALEDGRTEHGATEFLRAWMVGTVQTAKATPLSILCANGGVGKTTVSRVLCDKIRKHDSSAIPLLIESDQWRHLIQSTITLDALWDLAISRRFEQASRLLSNETALRVLIQEGLFVVVFDGFDELCVNPSCAYRPQDVLNELLNMLTPEDDVVQARILLTTRETFWDSIKEEINTDKLEIFRLKGFDNDQRKRYFSVRLSDPVERDIALRLSKQVSGGLYENIPPEDLNEERPSGVPFILDLIAHYVHDYPEANANPYKVDPLESLLEDICRRENNRQSLDINPKLQLLLFEELFREFPGGVSIEELKLYLEVVCNVSDQGVMQRFTNHAFLVRFQNDTYVPRYEVLRVYFVARFLAHGLATVSKKSERSKIARLLAENSTGKTQVIDWLLKQLKKLDETKLLEAVGHAMDIINDEDNREVHRSSSMALFHLVKNLITTSDKKERTVELSRYFRARSNNAVLVFSSICMTGLIKSFDLADCTFIGCSFIDAEFKNCRFTKTTNFKNCSFDGVLVFDNCDGPNEINSADCTFSKEAEYSINSIRNLGTSSQIKRSFAEDALSRALKKFRGDYGFMSIQYRHRISGFKSGNPYNKTIWDVLIKQSIIERHVISNVDDGGLNIAEDKDLRREILNYQDNAILGHRLGAVIDDLIS